VFDELLTLDEEEPQEEDTVSADDIDDLIFSEKKTVDEHLSELDDTEAQSEPTEEYPQGMADVGDPVSDGTEIQGSDLDDDAGISDLEDISDDEIAAAAASPAAARTAGDEPEAVAESEPVSEPETTASPDALSAAADTQQDDIDSLLSDVQSDDSVVMDSDSADSAPGDNIEAK